MVHRIEVAFKPKIRDVLGESIKKRIAEDLSINVDSVKTIDVFTIEENLKKEQLELLGKNLFSDPIIQFYSYDKALANNFSFLIEVGFKPGVTDNVGRTSKEAIKDILNIETNVYTSKQYLIKGLINKNDAEKIAKNLLANELIERWEIIDSNSWNNKVKIYLPKVREEKDVKVKEINLNVNYDELLKISKERVLALNLEEMKRIREYFKKLNRNPTDVEIEALAQTWSEHCKHKIFNALIEYEEDSKKIIINSLFKTFIKRATDEIDKKIDWLVSVFTDNAGVIKFNDKYNLVFKVETHNSPSALDPYGGAITGIVGVNRDPLGTGVGAKLIFNTNVFCFASPFYDKEIPQRLLHPKRVFEGVRKGVEHGGNKSGIPTVNGCIVFDERFLGKPLVYCGTGGIMPNKILNELSYVKKIDNDDLIVMVGGRVGKDGIHGATFSSEELHEGSPATAVQIGDPITQKKMSDFLLEVRDLGYYKAITDNGAGGLSSSVGEIAKLSGGCELHLDKVPLKYYGLSPWEILLSEAQERMTVAVSPEKINKFLELAKRRDVEATVLGKFNNSNKFHVLFNNKTVALLNMDFLHDGLPQMKLKAKWEKPKYKEPKFDDLPDLTESLKSLLARLNICSKEYVVRQYDHEVQGTSVIKPLIGINNDGPSDAAVLRPLFDSFEGIIVANGIVPRYSDIDTYNMMACAIDEAIRNIITIGGSLKQIAGLDNFCWCDPVKSEKTPDGEYKLAQLVRANMALHDYCKSFNVPCISGKDSMKNDYIIGDKKISVPPTILFSAIGKMNDVRKAITMDVKNEGDLVYILGITKNELGASEFYAMNGFVGNKVPTVNAKSAVKLYNALSKAIDNCLVASCHDCSDGGLGVALAESSFSGGFGIDIDLRKVHVENINRNDAILFSESQSRFVVTIKKKNKKEFEKIMKGSVFTNIGVVNGREFIVKGLNGNIIIKSNINDLKDAWQKTLRW